MYDSNYYVDIIIEGWIAAKNAKFYRKGLSNKQPTLALTCAHGFQNKKMYGDEDRLRGHDSDDLLLFKAS